MPVDANEPRAMDEWMAEVEERLRQLEARSLTAGEGTEIDQATDTITAKISADAGNIAKTGTDGGIYATVTTAVTSTCLDVTGDGTTNLPVTAAPVISPDAGNILECRVNGLFVTPPPPRAFEAVYAQVTADVAIGSGATATVVTAPAVTVDGATRIRISISWAATFSGADANRVDMRIREGATILGQATVSHDIATAGADTSGGSYQVELTPAAGAHTYNFAAFGRTNASTLEAGADHPASIRVEDARW